MNNRIKENPREYIITCRGDFVRITANELVGSEQNLVAIRAKLNSTGRFGGRSPEQVAKERYDKVLEMVNFDYERLHDWIYNNLEKIEIIKKEELRTTDYQEAIGAIFKYVKESFNGYEGKWRVKHPGGKEVLVNEETGQVIYYSESIQDKFNEAKKLTIPSHAGKVGGGSYDAVFIYLHCTYGHAGGGCISESKFPNVKFISPQSANLKYDMWHGSSPAPGGSQAQGWVNVTGDIHEIANELPNLGDIEDKVHIDYSQLRHSAAYVEELIEREMSNGIKPGRIFVSGFSSGALLTLTTALTSKHKLGGFLALSGILPRRDKLLPATNSANKNTPIFISNFPHDVWVPQWMGKKTAELLESNGYSKVITRFEGMTGHSYDSSDIEKFLSKYLALAEETEKETIRKQNQQNLQALTDWNLLSDAQKNDFLTRITADNFNQIKQAAEIAILAIKNKENVPPKRKPEEEDESTNPPKKPETKKPRNENSDENHNKPDQTPKSNQPLDEQVQQDMQNEQQTTQNNLNDNLSQAQSSNATVEDKVRAIKDWGKIYGEEGFEEQQKQIEVIMDELGRTDPPKLVEGLMGAIEENLRKNDLTMAELPSEIQADYQNIDNKDIANKINENISKKGVKKTLEKLKAEINKVAKLSKEKIQKIKEKLLRFIRSKNKYEQEYRKEAQNLLAQLERISQVQQSKSGFPTGWVIGGGVLIAIGLVAFLVIRKRRKRKLSH